MIERVLLVRAVGLYLPTVLTLLAWLWRRPLLRERAGVLLACVWNLVTLLILNGLAARLGWWSFEAEGGLLMGMPVELYLGWVLFWGAFPALAFRQVHLALVVALMVWLDLLVMPQATPVVRLGTNWLLGEAAGVALCLVPSQLLARWTAEDRNLPVRVCLQVVAFSGLVLVVVPQVILEQTGGDWAGLLSRSHWSLGLALQALAIPAVIGLSAVQEFANRGRGTPLPYDPPKRLVTTGPYAYVANPMQLSAVLLFIGWGLLLDNLWIAAAGIMAHIFSTGLAGWSEKQDLGERFGNRWQRYRRAVRNWWPRWRPWHASGSDTATPMARLYVATSCLPCSQFQQWFSRRNPTGLMVVPAREHPSRDLERITYDPQDGSPEESGIAGLARAIEHINLAYAWLAFVMRLPVVRPFLQLVADASGATPRQVRRSATAESRRPVPSRSN